MHESGLFYHDSGAGKTLLFLHGLGADHAMFAPQIEALQGRYRVLCPDLRGSGRSARLDGPVATVFDRQCDDLLALLDTLAIEQVVCCGTSYGGALGQHFALRYPQRVAGLVLTDTFSGIRRDRGYDWALLFVLYAGLWILYFPELLILILKWQYRKWPAVRDYLVQCMRGFRSKEALLQQVAITRTDHSPDVHRITCPVLCLVGDESTLLREYMQRLTQFIPQANLRVIPKSFDPSNLCNTPIYQQHLSAFLQKMGW